MNVGSGNHFNKSFSQAPHKGKPDYKKLVCDFCKRIGHTKDRCYKLHGFPNGFKGNKETRMASQVHGGNFDLTVNANASTQAHVHELTAA